MNALTVRTALHLAVLDPMTGEGLAVLPSPEDDIYLPHRVYLPGLGEVESQASLYGADWSHFLRQLAALGWEPLEDDDGLWCYAGETPDGRMVVGLYHNDPIREPSLHESVTASAELLGLILRSS